MKKVDELLADYAAYHRTRGNIVCHFIGIPSIIFGSFSLLQMLRIGPGSAAEILILAAIAYYLVLDVKLAFAMLLVSAALDAAAYAVADYRIGLGVFIAGWIFQGIGHAVYEKRSPAFLRNLVHLLVGPIFLINEAVHIRPIVAS
jgi:uncharacterized membrane protein YGL010W